MFSFVFSLIRNWDGSLRFMPRLKLSIIKHNTSTSNKNDNDDQIVSIDNENESMESDIE